MQEGQQRSIGRTRTPLVSDPPPAPTAPNVAVGVAAHAIGEARREVSELLATGDCAIDVEYRDIGWIGAIGRTRINEVVFQDRYTGLAYRVP